MFFDPEDRLIRASALPGALARLGLRRWDVIHVHTPFRAHALGVQLARQVKRPVVETYHTFFEEYVALYLPWLPSAPLRWLVRRLSRRMCNEVDHIILPSAEMAPVLAGYGVRTPASVLPTGIDLAAFTGGSGAAFRRRHGIAPDRPTLVTVSRLAKEKNIGFLLEVAARVRRAIPDLQFIVAGEGPDAARLKALAITLGLEDVVRFFGNLDRRRELLDCYRAGDVFVFASPTETQGLVLIEAMALGVPIVSTAVMGTATVLRHARGAVVSVEDADAFAAHVIAVLDAPHRRFTMAQAALEDALRWGNEARMGDVVDLYVRLARGLPADAPLHPVAVPGAGNA